MNVHLAHSFLQLISLYR